MIRIIFLAFLFLAALFVGGWVALPFTLVYAMRWYALELLPLALLLDGYFASMLTWPVFTVGACVVVLAAELAKRHLRFI